MALVQGMIKTKNDIQVDWTWRETTNMQGERHVALSQPDSKYGWRVMFDNSRDFDNFMEALRIAREQVFGRGWET